MKSAAGFTLIELITVIVLLGILAFTVMPKMNSSDFKAIAYRDEAASALRYAQKSATSHRRLVCASFAAGAITLQIASANPATSCNTNLPHPTGSNVIASNDSAVVFSPVPATLYFQPGGKITSDGAGTTIANVTLALPGLNVTIAGGAGYVH